MLLILVAILTSVLIWSGLHLKARTSVWNEEIRATEQLWNHDVFIVGNTSTTCSGWFGTIKYTTGPYEHPKEPYADWLKGGLSFYEHISAELAEAIRRCYPIAKKHNHAAHKRTSNGYFTTCILLSIILLPVALFFLGACLQCIVACTSLYGLFVPTKHSSSGFKEREGDLV
jgi:hypothetical protein